MTRLFEKRTPAERFPPSVHIADELEARGWTERDLAVRAGLSEKVIRNVLSDKRGINLPIARGIGRAFGTGPELWIALQQSFYATFELELHVEWHSQRGGASR